MKKRMLALLLAVALVFSMLPVSVFAEEYLIQDETVPVETIPEEIIPEETIPEETVPEETLPEETIPEETIPEETIPEETIPEETIPEETIPEETVPEETLPEETIPEETVPTRDETEITVIDSGTCGDDLTWTLTSDGTLTISGTGEMDYFYTYYQPWEDYRETMKTVIIEEGAININQYAFYGCTGLTSVSISNSVKTIGYNAFENCTGLTEITIPTGVRHITNDAFSGCTGLTEVTISDSVTMIGNSVFHGCIGLTEITIPDSVVSLGNSVFKNCRGLTAVTIGNKVSKFDFYAFWGCTGLTEIIIPDSVTYIGSGAFSGCTGLTEITIPDSVTYISSSAFSGCTGLTEITIPDSVTQIGNYAFENCTGLTEITIPNSVVNIYKGAFVGCSSLESITIPFVGTSRKSESDRSQEPLGMMFGTDRYNGSIETKQTYYGYSGTYETSVFYIPASLKSVTVTDGNILSGAFQNCTMLTSVSIPDCATNIGEYAFDGCTGLTEISVSEDHPAFCNDENGLLYSKDMTTLVQCPGGYSGTLVIPDSVTDIHDNALSACVKLTALQVSENNPNYCCDEYGVLYSKDMTTLIQCPGGYSGIFTIPETVTNINKYAFRGCVNLTGVIISENVNQIGKYAFAGCTALTSLTIPGSVTQISVNAFENCTALKTLKLEKGVESIWTEAFRGCTALTSVTIDGSVTTIGPYAFSYCTNLTCVIVGDSVTTIGNAAFYGCNNLQQIQFLGDAPSPDNVVLYGVTATVYYPAGNTTWTSDVKKDYGGNITWKAYADKGMCGDNLSWSMTEDGTLTVLGTGAMYDYTGEDQPWHELRDSITSVVIAKGATSVGNQAFDGYANIASVSFPDTLQTIGDGAFNGCPLQEVAIPKNVTRIGAYAFGSIPADSIVFAGSAPTMDENAFYGVEAYVSYPSNNDTWTSVAGNHYGGTLIWCPDGNAPTLPNPAVKEVIGSGTFNENGKWEVYNDGVLKISATADMTMSFETAPWYDYRTQIWEVDIGSGITALENGNLADLPLVTTVVIGPSVKSIGSKAFTGATRNLRFVMFEGDAPEINRDAFRGVTADVHFKTIYEAWEDAAYNDYRGTLNWIPHTDFSECGPDVLWFLEGDTLTITGLGVMNNFTGSDHPWKDFYNEIATVMVENGVTGIGDYTFAGLPAGVKVIFQGAGPAFGENAFSGVTATAYYPVEKENWTEDVMLQYGGTVTWVGYDKNTTPTFEKNEDVTYLSQTDAAKAINTHLLARDTEFSIYAYQTFNASTTQAQLMKVCETLFTSAFGKSDGANDWEYLDGHLLGYSYDLTYGHDTQKYYLNIHYTVSYLTTAEQEAKVDSKVKSILKSLDLKGESDYKKISGIYNYLIKNVNYDDTLAEEADLLKFSAYGALVNKKANSHGFAVAFYRLAEELGLYANIIRGNLTGSLEYDSWNIVYLNGYYYCIDAAQDAIRYDAGKSKSYFLKGTGYFENHEPAEEYQEVCDKYCSPINYRSDAVLVGTCGDTVYWTILKDNTLRIMGEGEMKGNQGYKQYTEYVDKIVIEDGVTNIVAWAFDDFQYVKSIKIPDSVTKIGDYAFSWCKSLKSIKIPNSVKTIGEHAFYYCKALTEVSIPGSVVSIGAYAFDGCTNIKKITLKEGLQTIGADAFSLTKISKITIPSTVTTIGAGAFSNCESLTSITIPENVTSLGAHAFSSCKKLTSVKLKCNITTLPTSCFSGCTKLTSITIPASVTTIGYGVFDTCLKMSSIIIEGDVQSIDRMAFYRVGPASIIFRGDAPKSINSGAFNSATYTLYYPADNETWTEEALARFGGTVTKKEIPCTLGQVKNLKVSSVSDSTVKISYSKVKNAAKYEIYVDGKLYDTTTSTSYTFKDLLGGQNYDVRVIAVKTSGGVLYCGPASQTIQVRPYYDLSKYKVTMEYNSVIYDGESKLPTITVQKNASSEPLVQDTDYTLTYEDNASIGTATVTVTGINAYGGEIVKTFEILPDQVQNLQAQTVSGTSVQLTFDPVPGAEEYWIYRDGERVQKTAETSCTVTGLSAGKNNVFTVKAAAEAKGEDYTGAASEAVAAQPFFTVSLSQYEFAYTGKYQRPTVTVYGYDGEELTEGVDYSLSFKNNKNTGKAYVQVKGKGNYDGSTKAYFVINPAQATGLKVSSTTKTSVKISYTKASSNSTKYYNIYVDGQHIARTTSSSYTIKNLELGKTYDVFVVPEKTVSGTAYYGEASEVITVWPGTYIGGYKATLDFTKATFTGEAHEPVVTVKTSSKSSATTLVENVDYIVTYENNAGPGKAKVIIQGIGGYTGTITKTFTINPPKVENVTAVAASNTSIKVSFDAAPGATSYWVYVNGEREAKITDTTCVIKGLKKNKTYKITVKAVAIVDGENYTSAATDAVKVKTVFVPAE